MEMPNGRVANLEESNGQWGETLHGGGMFRNLSGWREFF